MDEFAVLSNGWVCNVSIVIILLRNGSLTRWTDSGSVKRRSVQALSVSMVFVRKRAVLTYDVVVHGMPVTSRRSREH
jgi:hypothetical protein